MEVRDIQGILGPKGVGIHNTIGLHILLDNR